MVGREWTVLLIGGQGNDPCVGEENKKKTCSATANLIRKVPSESYSTKPSKVPSQENQVLLLEVSKFMLTTCTGDMDELVAARQSSLGRGDRIWIKIVSLRLSCRCKVHRDLRSMCWSETDYVPSHRVITCADFQSLHRS